MIVQPQHEVERTRIAPRMRGFTLIVLCVMALMNAFSIWNLRQLIAQGHSDFVSYYAAGKMLRSGQGEQLFDSAAQFEIQQQFSAFVRARKQPFPYIHPPFEAILFTPLSYLPYLPAYLVWTALNLFLLASTPHLLARVIPPLNHLPSTLWIVLPFAFFPFVSLFVQGQDDLIFLVLAILCFLAVRRHAPFQAGCWLGLALIRPQFCIPLLLILVLGGEWALLGGFLLVAAGLSLLTMVVFGWSQFAGYPRHLFSSELISNPNGVLLGAMPNLHGMTAKLLTGSMLSSALVIALSSAVLFLAIWFWRKRSLDQPESAFSLAVVATLLVSYHAFPHDLTLLILPVLLQGSWLLKCKPGQLRPWVPILPTLLFLVPPLCYLLIRHDQLNLIGSLLLLWFAGSLAL